MAIMHNRPCNTFKILYNIDIPLTKGEYMGYTHYWDTNSIQGQAQQQEKSFKRAITQCQKIIQGYNTSLKSQDPKHYARLAGYSAHAQINQYGGLSINGVQEEGHESFDIREHFNQNTEGDFCKTAQKPYDVVVVACLATLKHYLKEGFNVSSDGDAADWADGVKLANKILGLKSIKTPKTIQ